MRSIVFVCYLQDWSLGINERSELLPPLKKFFTYPGRIINIQANSSLLD
jgi:hypothetical protein